MKNRIIGTIFLLFLSLGGLKMVQAAPNDPHFKKQWYLNRIGFDYVWNREFRGSEVVVAVVDSGVDVYHPDLKGSIWFNHFEIEANGIDDDHNGFIDDVYGWNFVDNNADPRPRVLPSSNDDGLNHGTMVAGIIGAQINNDLGISGIAPRVKIMALRAVNERGEGKINDVIRAIDYAINNGADIINLSFTGSNYNKGFREAIERANRAGIIVVTAAGNNSANLDLDPLYPACFQGNEGERILVSVSATDALDQKTNFSSYGRNCVDISAPGISFFSTSFFDSEKNEPLDYNGYWSGTSMSTAVISGSLALIKNINPKLNRSELLEVLFKSSDQLNLLNPDYQNSLGAGRVNLYNAVNWAEEKWDNLSNRFIVFPQSKIAEFKTEDNNFNYLRILKNRGVEEKRFLAFGPDFNASVSIASNESKIVVGAGLGGGPQVRIFDKTSKLENQFFAYNEKFRGGVNVAVGDLDGDGRAEIVTGAGPGGGPHVRIFDLAGNLKGQFFAYEDSFLGGVKVKVANVLGLKTKDQQEIIVSPGPGRLAEVKIFSRYGQEFKKFLAYDNNFSNGVNLAVGDLNKDGLSEIITGAGPGGAPHVRAFDGQGNLKASFYALESDFEGGVIVDFMELE